MHYLFVRNLPVLPSEKEFALIFFSGILPFVVERSETGKDKNRSAVGVSPRSA